MLFSRNWRRNIRFIVFWAVLVAVSEIAGHVLKLANLTFLVGENNKIFSGNHRNYFFDFLFLGSDQGFSTAVSNLWPYCSKTGKAVRFAPDCFMIFFLKTRKPDLFFLVSRSNFFFLLISCCFCLAAMYFHNCY